MPLTRKKKQITLVFNAKKFFPGNAISSQIKKTFPTNIVKSQVEEGIKKGILTYSFEGDVRFFNMFLRSSKFDIQTCLTGYTYPSITTDTLKENLNNDIFGAPSLFLESIDNQFYNSSNVFHGFIENQFYDKNDTQYSYFHTTAFNDETYLNLKKKIDPKAIYSKYFAKIFKEQPRGYLTYIQDISQKEDYRIQRLGKSAVDDLIHKWRKPDYISKTYSEKANLVCAMKLNFNNQILKKELFYSKQPVVIFNSTFNEDINKYKIYTNLPFEESERNKLINLKSVRFAVINEQLLSENNLNKKLYLADNIRNETILRNIQHPDQLISYNKIGANVYNDFNQLLPFYQQKFEKTDLNTIKKYFPKVLEEIVSNRIIDFKTLNNEQKNNLINIYLKEKENFIEIAWKMIEVDIKSECAIIVTKLAIFDLINVFQLKGEEGLLYATMHSIFN